MQLTRYGLVRLAGLAVFSTLVLAGCQHSDVSDNSTLPSASNAVDAAATITTPKGASLTLTQAEFDTQLQSFVPNSPPSPVAPQGSYAAPGQSAGRLVMQQMIGNLLLEGLAQDEGVAPTDAEVNAQYNNIKMVQEARSIKTFEETLNDAGLSPESFKELQVKPQLAQLKLLTKGVTISDTDIQNFYNANKDKQFTKPARVHIKRIVVATPAEAQSIASAIKSGQTFESQVSQSLDKSSPEGDVAQWVPLDNPDPRMASLIKPISATPAGQVTPPITVPGPNGQDTYWLVKIVERREKETLPLDEVKDLIRANLLQQKAQANSAGQQAIQQQLHDFQSHSKIAIAGPQYAPLVQTLMHPTPLPAPAPITTLTPPTAPPGKH